MNDETLKIAKTLCNLQSNKNRLMIAIAGPPGAGKSTFAESLAPLINNIKGVTTATILPMDGFHLDNSILQQQDALDRKGAPHTFDVEGFIEIVKRISTSESDVIVPVFDRALDLARAGARQIQPEHSIVLVEGNYLLLDQHPWSSLHSIFDYRIYLDVPQQILNERLTQRWIDHDHTPEQAVIRAESNDLPNARLVATCRLSADKIISPC